MKRASMSHAPCKARGPLGWAERRRGLCGLAAWALVGCSSGGAIEENLPDLGMMTDGETLGLQQVKPATASTAGGSELRLIGSGFGRGATVAIDGLSVADVTYVSSRELSLKVPSRLGAFGRVPIAVQNPGGGRVVRSDLFSYVPATVSFAGRVDYGTQKRPLFVAVGDMNSDQRADLVVTNSNENSLSLLFGNGDGSFAVQQIWPTSVAPHGLKLADFNEDGKSDYAVVNRTDNTFSVFLGNGDGTFAPSSSSAAATSPIGLAVGDVNGDGHQDLVSASTVASLVMPPALASSKIVVHLGRGDGTFGGYLESAVAGGTREILLADLNADGFLDVVVAAMDSERVSVLLGRGDGTFPSRFDYATGALPSGVAVGLFNADPRPDLVVSNSGSNTVSIYLNTSQ